jgi:hypothetical protein
MNIYIGLFLFSIAAFIIYRLIKIRNQFRRVVSQEEKVMRYCSTGIKSWPTTPATLDSIEVQAVTNSQPEKFKLITQFTFQVNGQPYSCSQSPYSELTTASNVAAQSLQNDITSGGEYLIYYNPANANESFYIFNGFLSWSDYEMLVKINN